MPREGATERQNREESQKAQCIGVSRGGRSTKIHAVVDALGNPIHVQLTAGNVNDVTVAEQLLEHVDFRGSTVLADKAYGKWAFRAFIADHDADFCIPPKSNETDPWFCDWWRYKERHLVEVFFLKLKEFRALPHATTSSLDASSALFTLPVFVFFLHNFVQYAFRDRP